MSFWDRVGAIFGAGGGDSSAVPSTFNTAQALMGQNTGLSVLQSGTGDSTIQAAPSNPNGWDTANGALSKGISKVVAGLSYVPLKAGHGLSAAWNVGDISEANGGSQWRPFYDLTDWKNAWNATSEGFTPGKPGLGQSVVHSIADKNFFTAGSNVPQGGAFGTGAAADALRAENTRIDNTWTGRIASGAIDTIATWYADPTILGGKLAKASRAASTIVDAADATKATEAATQINQGATRAVGTYNPTRLLPGQNGPFTKAMCESGQRIFRFVVTTDNKSAAESPELAVFLKRNPNSAPVMGLFDQASKITDLDLQRQVKIDVLGTAQNDPVARQRLIDSAPAVARAQMRASVAPEGRDSLDAIHDAMATLDANDPASLAAAGMSMHQAASALATPESMAELNSYGTHLDNIHNALEGLDSIAASAPLEQAGLTALDRAKVGLRGKMANDFYFQDGASGATVRVLHWAAGQRFRGTIATDNALRGNAELMDHLTRTKLFTASERKDFSNRFLTAATREQRVRIADGVWDAMYAKIGSANGMTADEVEHIANTSKTIRQNGRLYAAQQLEDARARNLKTVVLHDPTKNTATSVRRAVFDTHINNNVSLPEPQDIQDGIRQYRNGGLTPKDQIGLKARQFSNGLEHMNNVWRIAVLARPGLLVRTQIDTQGRALAILGGSTVAMQAAKGIGHKVGKAINGDQLAAWDGMAADLHRADELDDLSTEQLRRAGFLQGDAADRLKAKAAQNKEQAQVLRDTKHWGYKYRLGGETTYNLGKGRSVTSRAYTDAQNTRDLRSALYPGGSPGDALTMSVPSNSSEVLQNAIGRKTGKLYEDASNWVTQAPDSNYWAPAWVRTTDQMRNSYTARKVLKEADHPTADLVTSLRNDPQVRAEWREVRGDNEDFNGWLSRVIDHVSWAAPTSDVRKALITKGRMSPDEVNKMFAKVGDDASTKPQRMYIQGPAISPVAPAGQKADGVARKLISAMSDKPDYALGRHPVYVDRYRHHFTGLATRELDRTGDDVLSHEAQVHIERVSQHRAIQDVQQVMYDTAKYTGAHATLRYLSPFVGAWQDAIESWSRLMYDNPAVAGAFNKIWNAPNRMGMVVDENGNPIKPGQQANQSFLVLPAEFNNNFAQSKKFQIRKDSLNSIFQGAQWYTPGFGPAVQIPAQEIIARTFPELGDSKNPLVQSVLPFGTPKVGAGLSGLAGDIAGTVAPGYSRAFYSAFAANNRDNLQAYQSSINQQIINARKAGKEIPSKATLDRNAQAAARTAGFVRAISLFGLGVSGTSTNVADFYKKQYDLLQQQQATFAAQGKSVSEVFNEEFPEAAGLSWSISKTATSVSPSLKAFDAEKRYAKQIKLNPTYGWFYVGADNVGGDFSQSVYNAQSSRTPGLSGSGLERTTQTRGSLIDSSVAEDGWNKYQAVSQAIDNALAARGLHSVNQKGAEDIQAARSQFIDALRLSNGAWAKDFDDQDSGKLQRFIEQVATPAIADPALKSRSDIKDLSDYLTLRTAALAKLQTMGLKSLSSNAASDLRDVLDEYGTSLARDNLGFQQTWTRMLQNEVQPTLADQQKAS